MLRAAFRNRLSKGPDNGSDLTPSTSDSEDEYHDFKMEFPRDSDLDEAEVHSTEKSDESSVTSGKDSEKFSENSKANSLSKSEITASNENSLKTIQGAEEEKTFPHTEREIYEIQLLQLQEQLVATIISEQEKGESLIYF